MIGNDWDKELEVIWKSPNFNKFYNNVLKLYDKDTIFPPKELIFNALKLTPYKDVKVVIVGQDPYHGDGEAHGLSFSVQKGIKLPPSLKNIYKELESDLGIIPSKDGDLTNKVTVNGSVNTSVKGIYKIVYSVVDSSRITTSATRTITVE